jgi:hypothetical protein
MIENSHDFLKHMTYPTGIWMTHASMKDVFFILELRIDGLL